MFEKESQCGLKGRSQQDYGRGVTALCDVTWSMELLWLTILKKKANVVFFGYFLSLLWKILDQNSYLAGLDFAVNVYY